MDTNGIELFRRLPADVLGHIGKHLTIAEQERLAFVTTPKLDTGRARAAAAELQRESISRGDPAAGLILRYGSGVRAVVRHLRDGDFHESHSAKAALRDESLMSSLEQQPQWKKQFGELIRWREIMKNPESRRNVPVAEALKKVTSVPFARAAILEDPRSSDENLAQAIQHASHEHEITRALRHPNAGLNVLRAASEKTTSEKNRKIARNHPAADARFLSKCASSEHDQNALRTLQDKAEAMPPGDFDAQWLRRTIAVNARDPELRSQLLRSGNPYALAGLAVHSQTALERETILNHRHCTQNAREALAAGCTDLAEFRQLEKGAAPEGTYAQNSLYMQVREPRIRHALRESLEKQLPPAALCDFWGTYQTVGDAEKTAMLQTKSKLAALMDNAMTSEERIENLDHPLSHFIQLSKYAEQVSSDGEWLKMLAHPEILKNSGNHEAAIDLLAKSASNTSRQLALLRHPGISNNMIVQALDMFTPETKASTEFRAWKRANWEIFSRYLAAGPPNDKTLALRLQNPELTAEELYLLARNARRAGSESQRAILRHPNLDRNTLYAMSAAPEYRNIRHDIFAHRLSDPQIKKMLIAGVEDPGEHLVHAAFADA